MGIAFFGGRCGRFHCRGFQPPSHRLECLSRSRPGIESLNHNATPQAMAECFRLHSSAERRVRERERDEPRASLLQPRKRHASPPPPAEGLLFVLDSPVCSRRRNSRAFLPLCKAEAFSCIHVLRPPLLSRQITTHHLLTRVFSSLGNESRRKMCMPCILFSSYTFRE